MLQRFTQVGEFYVMTMPEGLKEGAIGFMDILIYDEESDRHVKISYRSALVATGLFKVDLSALEDVISKDTELGPTGEGTIGTWAGQALKLLTANETGVTAANLDKGNKAGEYIVGKDAPVVIARPFIEHAMLSAVLTVSGGDTGATIFGPSDMQISANTSVKTIEGYACLLNPLSHITHTISTVFNTARQCKGRNWKLDIASRAYFC